MRWGHRALLAIAVIVAAVIILDSSGVLPSLPSQLIDDLGQLAAATFACVSCAVVSRRVQGIERTWRVLVAIGMGGWAAGQLIWTWYLVARDRGLPSPSPSDIGYLMLPTFAFAAVVVISATGRPGTQLDHDGVGSIVPAWVQLLLDGLIVTGSVLLLATLTSLDPLLGLRTASPFTVTLAWAYPVTDLLLAIMVLLMLATRPVPLRLRPQLVLLGLGLLSFAASDTVFAHLVTRGADFIPPRYDIGFIVGPLLIGLAGLTLGAPEQAVSAEDRPGGIPWARLLLPYVPLVITGGMFLAQEILGHEEEMLELLLGIPIISLILIRQFIVVVDNAFLLRRVSDAQELLRFQANHDPLTGLANRNLFQTRLVEVVEHERDGRMMAMFLLDLDDFKEINDRYGHAVGDQVLKEVARRLRSSVRGGDLVARLGGDEFGVLTQADTVPPREIGLRILTSLRQPFMAAGYLANVGASMGGAIASGVEADLTAEALQQRADAAMYAGKRRGKGLLMFYGTETAE
jgi:diguanylate cyclase